MFKCVLSFPVRMSERIPGIMITGRNSRDRSLLAAAYWYAQAFSDDPRTWNGAVIADPQGRVLAGAANSFPEGLRVTPERLERPLKYDWMGHAEENSIVAVRELQEQGISTQGTTMYCPWYACTGCARDIINAGITRVVGHYEVLERSEQKWTDSIMVALGMLREAGVLAQWYKGKVDSLPQMFNGERWTPR